MSEWRYLLRGKVVHALQFPGASGAQCGIYALPASAWRGTGSQLEYETAERLPRCKHCLAQIGERS